MKRIFSLLTILLLSVTLVRAQIAPVYAGMFQNVLDSVCQKHGLKGASAAILVPGMGVWTGVYGESHAGVPITRDMYIPIGSNTKTFASIILLKMQEQGILSLDDSIGTWLQGIKNVNGQITIRQMLNHTSGLANYTMHKDFFVALNADYTRIFQPEEMLQFIDTPSFTPGAKWDYSNTNYLLAGLIIKKIRQEPFGATVRDMILKPLKLQHTINFPEEQPKVAEPHGWSDGASGKLEDMQVDYGWSNNAFSSMASSAGGMMSTAEDNVIFWNALMTGKLLNQTSFDQMKTFVSMSLGPYRGYGLALATGLSNMRRIYAHRGTCFGYLNENLVDSASGVCITVLTNHDDYRNNDFLYAQLLRPLHAITIKLPPAAIQEVGYDYQVNLYPNPAVNTVHVNMEGINSDAKMDVYDMTGKLLLSAQLDKNNTEVSVSSLLTGLYIVRMHNEDGILHTEKLQIVK